MWLISVPRFELWGLTICVAALLACGLDSKKEGEAKQAKKASGPPELTVTAEAIFDEYKANEARADSRFKNKRIEVTGKVSGVDSDIMDNPVVKLATSNQFMPISLSDVKKEVAIELNKGDDVHFVCTGAGEVAGHPQLKDCEKK